MKVKICPKPAATNEDAASLTRNSPAIPIVEPQERKIGKSVCLRAKFQQSKMKSRKRESDFVIPITRKVQTASGIYSCQTTSPETKSNLYKVKFFGRVVAKEYYLSLDTNDLANCLHFPFAARLVHMLMFAENVPLVFQLNEFALAIDCVMRISQFVYEKTGFIHNIPSISHKGIQSCSFEIILVKYFIPAFIVFVHAHDISAVLPLRPFIRILIKKGLVFRFYQGPLGSLQQFFFAKFGIDIAEIKNENERKRVTLSLDIDLAIIHMTYCHLQQSQTETLQHQISDNESSLNVSLFFHLLWKEINEANVAHRILGQFYTVKFVDVLDSITNIDELNAEVVTKTFGSLSKLLDACPNGKFTNIFMPINRIGVLINRVFDYLNVLSNHEFFKSTKPKEYVLLLKYFQQFIQFFIKYSMYCDYKNWDSNSITFDLFERNIFSLELFVKRLSMLQLMKNDVLSFHFKIFLKNIQNVQLPPPYCNTQPAVTSQQSFEQPKQANVVESKQLNIEDEILYLKYVFYILKNTNQNSTDYSSKFAFEVESCLRRQAGFIQILDLRNYAKSVFVLESLLKIFEKEPSEWTLDDKNYLKASSAMFSFLFSDRYVRDLFEDVENVQEMKKLLGILLRHHQCIQKQFFYAFDMQRLEELN